jgi:transposase
MAKTDARDARALAHCAEAVRPTPRPLPDAHAAELRALLARRRQLVARRTTEQKRLASAPRRLQPAIQAHSTWLNSRVAARDDDWDTTLRASPVGRERQEVLRSVPGMGPVCARTLLLAWPELGTVRRQRLAALAAVAPCNRDSGTRRGTRTVWGGRAPGRTALDRSTLVAVRYHPVLKACYERLRAAGKAAKGALTACMRKLLTILNAMVQHQKPWQPQEVASAEHTRRRLTNKTVAPLRCGFQARLTPSVALSRCAAVFLPFPRLASSIPSQ